MVIRVLRAVFLLGFATVPWMVVFLFALSLFRTADDSIGAQTL